MVGEAYEHVQGESLKSCAALLTEAYQLPDHQWGKAKMRSYLKPIAFSATLITLTACGHVQVSDVVGTAGIHELTYSYGAVDSEAIIRDAIEQKATTLCGGAFSVVSQKRFNNGDVVAPTIVWDVRCSP